MAPFSSPSNTVDRSPSSFRVVVLASGNGSNFQAILDRFAEAPVAGRSVEISGLVTNKREALAIKRAQRAGVEIGIFERDDYETREARDMAMADWIEGHHANLIVAAGYMEILSAQFVSRFRGRVINIHPSLLPNHRGLNAIEKAFHGGERLSGVTVHFVDEGVDTGPTIEQRKVRIRRWRGLERFEKRMHAMEHRLLPEVVENAARGRLDLGVESEVSRHEIRASSESAAQETRLRTARA